MTILIFQEIEAVNKTGDHDAMRKFLRDNKILLSISFTIIPEYHLPWLSGNAVDTNDDNIDDDKETQFSVAR